MVASPQLPSISKELKAASKLDFDLLYDKDHALARAWGIEMVLPADLIEIYRKFGLDLPKAAGDAEMPANWRLPAPSRLVVDRNGKVASIETDPDYTTRPEPEETLTVVRGLK